jgi:hypothetical protein
MALFNPKVRRHPPDFPAGNCSTVVNAGDYEAYISKVEALIETLPPLPIYYWSESSSMYKMAKIVPIWPGIQKWMAPDLRRGNRPVFFSTELLCPDADVPSFAEAKSVMPAFSVGMAGPPGGAPIGGGWMRYPPSRCDLVKRFAGCAQPSQFHYNF